jgi:hypothetical protein
MTTSPTEEPFPDLRRIVSEEVLRHRIREGIAETDKPTVWRALLAAPLTSVIVAGILGAWLTHQYDTQRLRTENELIRSRAESDRTLTQHETEVSHAFTTFEAVSRILDKRLWRARNLVWASQDGADSAEIARRRAAYRDAVNEWNESLNRNLALVEKYFGLKQRGELEIAISDGLRIINAELRNKDVSSKQLIERINTLNSTIYAFDVQLLQMVQTGRVGMFKAGP